MAGVAGSEPQDLSPDVQQAPSMAPAPRGTPAPAAAPAPADTSELDQFVASYKPPSDTSDLDAFVKGHAAEPEESTTMKALKTAGKVLDYPGGLVRAGVGRVLGLGGEELSKAAVEGNAPTSAQLLEKAGVDEGPNYQVPGLGHVSLRDVEGLALDIASDPLTAVTKLAKEAPYIGKLINAPGEAADTVGKWLYNSAFSSVDAKLAKKGVEPVSALMAERGVTGTAKQVEQKATEIAGEMSNFRQSLYNKADQLGAKVDLANPNITKRTDGVIAAMKKDPGLAPQAAELEAMLQRYKNAGQVSLADASEFKTNLYNALPASAFDGFGKAKSTAMRFKAALASDLRQAIVDAGEQADKGLGDAIAKTNDKWGLLISAKKPLNQMANSPGSGLGHMVDATLLGSGHVPAYLGKKATELATGTYARTKLGAALSAAGRDGVVSDIARRALIDANKPPETP
jgi:hypothetical protein